MYDLISRQAAIDAVNEYLRISECSKTIQNMTSIQAILRWLPSAEPRCYLGSPCEYQNAEIRLPTAERKAGHWKPRKHYVSPLHEAFVEDYECSNCHFQLGELEWKYCPNCGSRMEDQPCRE